MTARVRPLANLFLQGIAMAALVGCSVDDRSVSVQDFCDTFLGLEADLTVACRGGSRSAFDVLNGQTGWCSSIQAELAAGAVTFDSTAAAACLAEVRALRCGQGMPSAPDCLKVYRGVIPEHGTCFPAGGTSIGLDVEECVPGTRCVADMTCPGTCVRYAQLGDPCTAALLTAQVVSNASDFGGPTLCAPGLICGPDSVCLAPPSPALGSTCSSWADCQSETADLIWSASTWPLSLTCADQNGPVADGTSGAGTCQPVTADGPCFSGVDCQSISCVGANPPYTLGVCSPPKVPGDSCTPGAFQCGPYAYCATTNTCTILPSVGQACPLNAGEGGECLVGVCPNDFCEAQPLGQAGDYCPCASGLTCEPLTEKCVPTCQRGAMCGAPGQPCCEGTNDLGPTRQGTCKTQFGCVDGQCAPSSSLSVG